MVDNGLLTRVRRNCFAVYNVVYRFSFFWECLFCKIIFCKPLCCMLKQLHRIQCNGVQKRIVRKKGYSQRKVNLYAMMNVKYKREHYLWIQKYSAILLFNCLTLAATQVRLLLHSNSQSPAKSLIMWVSFMVPYDNMYLVIVRYIHCDQH